VLAYHRGPRNLLVDLGCGHGLISRELSKDFKRVIATDPSSGMVKQAQEQSPKSEYPNVDFQVAAAESLPFVQDGSVDMVVAGQAAHWFNYDVVFPELKRILRKGGTLAFWGYKDHVYIGYPRASDIVQRYYYGDDPERNLGRYWEPGRFIVRNKLRDVKPPGELYEDETRVEYEPDPAKANSGEGKMFMTKDMTLGQSKDYVRTASAFHEWERKHPQNKSRKEGGPGDLVDWMYDEMSEAEGWKDNDMPLTLEWGSAIVMARRR
jgi:SAM-dependent methyltransferase